MKTLSLFLAAVLLANCTVYRTVRRPPESIDPDHRIMLYMDELKFKLVEASVSSDTLIGRISYDLNEPGKKSLVIVCLKPGQQPPQDSAGLLKIPFSMIEYVEFCELDRDESGRQTTIAIVAILGGGLLLILSLFAAGMANFDLNITGAQK